MLDVHLPDVNGIEVCRRLKNQQNCSVMVLQISASALSAAHAKEALDAGADAYLMEPVGPDVLVATVKALLRLHQAERSLVNANRQLEMVNRKSFKGRIKIYNILHLPPVTICRNRSNHFNLHRTDRARDER